MALDEQLRQLANAVPEPPPGDASSAFRRGTRRRRVRHGAGAAAVVSLVAVLGVGVASLVGAPTSPDIAEQPPASSDRDDGAAGREDWPVITSPPQLTVSAGRPFPWVVAVAAGEDGRWCATAVRGATDVSDTVGRPCDQVLTPEQAGDPDGFGTGGYELEATPWGEPGQGLSWGFAPPGTDEVFVLLSDGSREQATVATGGSVPARLWAIGYEGAEVQVVEARRGGEVIAGRIPATIAGDEGTAPDPHAVFGDRLQGQAVEAFTDEQRRLLDLRASDELSWLPIEGTADRAVGIRARDGSAPLMFATACTLLDQVELPDGWLGLCLEHTDAEQGRVRGLFPHGTVGDN